MPSLLLPRLLLALACHAPAPPADSGCAEDEPTTLCAETLAVEGPTSSVPEQPVALPSRAVSIEVGDLAGTGTPQVYVGTTSTVSRLDGEGWQERTDLWESHSGSVHPLIADLNGDGAMDLVVGLPGSNEGLGQVLVFSGPLTEPVDWDTPHLTLVGPDHRVVGDELLARDLNGDGLTDLVVGDWLRFGPITDDEPMGATGDATLEPQDGAFVLGPAAVGDLNGDGRDDLVLLVSREADDPCAWPSAALHLLPGPLGPGSLVVDDATLALSLPGDSAPLAALAIQAAFRDGRSLAVIDLDGDGSEDVLTGALSTRPDTLGRPEVLAFSGPLDAAAPPLARFVALGYLAEVGDLTGDSLPDLVQADFEGCSSCDPALGPAVLHGPLSQADPLDTDACTWQADELWPTHTLRDLWIGDLDGDGLPDRVTATDTEVFVALGS